MTDSPQTSAHSNSVSTDREQPLPIADNLLTLDTPVSPCPTRRTRTITAPQLAALASTADHLSVDPQTGRCRLSHPHPAYPPDLRLLELARKSGRSSHNRTQMIELLTTVGYRRSIEPTLAKHPLLIHTARGHWSIRTPTQPPGPPIR